MEKKLFTLSSPNSPDEFALYYQFRWQQLRQPLDFPPGSERDEHEEIAFHRMAINADNEIVGVGRVHLETPLRAKVRYMATAADMQRKGVASAILKDLLEYATENHAEVCWLNARESVCPFYLSQGFKVIGYGTSELPIPHMYMERKLIGKSL